MSQDSTRASYDAVAAAYAEAMSDELRHKPLDRALLAAFAEAGFAVESLTRREPYPDAEVATPRAYFLARAVRS